MLKLVAALLLIAGTLVLAVVVTVPGTAPAVPQALAGAAQLAPWTPGASTLAAGILIGIALARVWAWIWSLPWGQIPVMIANWFGRWTRRAKLIGLGALFACVILYF